MADKLKLTAVFDNDQKTCPVYYSIGSNEGQVEAARAYIDRVVPKGGEGPRRDVRVVTIKEV